MKVRNLETYMARLVNRVQALEAALGRPVLDEKSETVVKAGKKGKKKIKLAAEKAAVVIATEDGPVEVKPARAKREYTEEERKAIGVRLQTARAANLGLTYDEFKAMRLRPGAKPTKEQMAEVLKARKAAKRTKKTK